MITINPKNVKQQEVSKWLAGGIAPRPIAFVSTISKEGIKNLAPFSYFNAFGSNPPMVAFSTTIKGRDISVKDTYNNIMETGECVIHAVTYDIMEQMNLASSEFPPETDEFEKSGFTPVKSEIVQPFRVKESPFQMECKLFKMVPLGEGPGSGNLAICEVLLFHIDESIISDNNIEPDLIDLIGRNGKNWYTRSSGSAMIELKRPSHNEAIGYNNIPKHIRNSHIYSANNLGLLAGEKAIPSKEEVDELIGSYNIIEYDELAFNRFLGVADFESMLIASKSLHKNNHPKSKIFFELTAKTALDARETYFGFCVAMYWKYI